ncbi:unnamed protein product [Rotaria sp. Silwood2]|nr:unnamed protein product [Rotaria sp. Silwood2]
MYNLLHQHQQLVQHQNERTYTSQYFDSKVNVISQSSNPYQEVDDYLAADFRQSFFDDNNSDDIHILLFWQEKQQLFPILSKIAKVICAVPAANTIIERLFSAAKNVITEKKNTFRL